VSATHHETPTTFGLLAEFETADDLVHATEAAAKEGFSVMDGYSPYPVGEVADALGFPRSEIGAIMFIGGLCGATMGFLMQAYLNGIEYPINVAGKPVSFGSWPQFGPITWELLVLSASLSGVIGLFALCGLPQPYHPLFNVPVFKRATRDRFFLCIEATDPKFDMTKTRAFLDTLKPLSISEVPE
jgi:Protein of unknown function (DUF3341)